MNIWQDLKERKILDKDGKVDALGPMGKSKLSGKEVSAYFRKYKVKDPEIRKAVEVALDLGGAMDVAGKEIQKFYGRKVRNSKEVKFALKYANESYEINEGKSLKQLFRMFKKDIKNYNNNKDLSQDAAMAFAYWAIKNGEIKTDDPDEFDQWLDNNLPEGAEPFLDQLVKIQFNSSDPEKAEKMLKAAAKKGLLGYNGPMKHGGIVGNDSFIVVGKEKDVDKVLNSMRKIMSTGRRLMNMPKLSLIQYNSFDYGDGKTLMEASAFAVMQDIVKNKQAQKIKGTMVDMFTASVVVKAYDKVNDSNKKKIEKAPLETLVKLAHKVMGMKEEDEQNEWISKDGARRRVAEKDQRKDVKEGDDSLGAKKFQNPLKKKGYPYQEQVNVLDTFRNMREAIDLEEVKSILQKDIKGLKHISDIEIRFDDEKEWKRMGAFIKRELKKPEYKGIKSKDVYFIDDPLQIGFGSPKGGAKINIKPIVDLVVSQTKDPRTRIKSLQEESWKAGEEKPIQSIQEAPVLPSTMTGGVQSDHSIEDGVKKYEDAINKQIQSGEFAKMHKERKTEVKARKAQKFYRVETWEMGKAGSIHAFIEIETGDIFKPAGWKAPAKGARGNVTDQRYIDYVAKYPRAYHGGHLYK